MNNTVVVWLLVHYANNMALGPEFKSAELCERAAITIKQAVDNSLVFSILKPICVRIEK